jgi:hypothetical protein
MFHPNRFGRLLLPVALVLLIAPLTAAGAGACEKHLNGHQQGSDTNGEGARR